MIRLEAANTKDLIGTVTWVTCPLLYVNESGQATHPVLASRLKVSELKGWSLMIHASGDNYSDRPEKLGGAGAQIACGIQIAHRILWCVSDQAISIPAFSKIKY